MCIRDSLRDRRPPRSTPLYSSAASDVYKRQFKEDELREFFVANMIVEDKVYPATLVREGAKNYQEYIKRKQSLAYNFKQDVSTLHDISHLFDKLFIIDGMHPPLLSTFRW